MSKRVTEPPEPQAQNFNNIKIVDGECKFVSTGLFCFDSSDLVWSYQADPKDWEDETNVSEG